MNPAAMNRAVFSGDGLKAYYGSIFSGYKKLFGAVVGIIIDSRAKTLALEKGLYVVKIHEDEERLDIEKPETCRTEPPKSTRIV